MTRRFTILAGGLLFLAINGCCHYGPYGGGACGGACGPAGYPGAYNGGYGASAAYPYGTQSAYGYTNQQTAAGFVPYGPVTASAPVDYLPAY